MTEYSCTPRARRGTTTYPDRLFSRQFQSRICAAHAQLPTCGQDRPMAYEHPNQQYNHHDPFANQQSTSGPPYVTDSVYPPSSAHTLPTYAHAHTHTHTHPQYSTTHYDYPAHSPSAPHPYALPTTHPAPYYDTPHQYQQHHTL
ncbi:hypothetical protein RhiXN_01934 [Rhizoctonia solani]|uniref:Uncharacterized protein n=1 Tax=Rhizoctonia solani TaxID=456999 RepID=A0A8H8T3M4_9AGAM|nr:uncharacterized protein RhiXN_01934 [Rhizoctonia solani]QRW27339.1 hypothetical protein RhiXN_01934 [Rhizoctonia solani]